ncbi:MAG: dihydroxy-acid dehydratase, partial [Verrucomicrobiota bacterium]
HVLVLAGIGPIGAGMPETYQLTSALKYLPFGKQVALLTDARFSGVSTGACIGHISPEALSGGPLGRLRTGDPIRVCVDTQKLTGSVDYLGPGDLGKRSLNPIFQPNDQLPDDTHLWAALQAVSGGSWAGCVYDVEKIVAKLES